MTLKFYTDEVKLKKPVKLMNVSKVFNLPRINRIFESNIVGFKTFLNLHQSYRPWEKYMVEINSKILLSLHWKYDEIIH